MSNIRRNTEADMWKVTSSLFLGKFIRMSLWKIIGQFFPVFRWFLFSAFRVICKSLTVAKISSLRWYGKLLKNFLITALKLGKNFLFVCTVVEYYSHESANWFLHLIKCLKESLGCVCDFWNTKKAGKNLITTY